MQLQRLFELFLIEFILYLLLWLWHDYIATILSITFACIIFSVWVISYIVEWISPSKVPSWYFQLMLLSIIAPILASLVYVGFMGGDLNWLSE